MLQLEDLAGNQLEKFWLPSSEKTATIFSLQLEAGCGHFGGVVSLDRHSVSVQCYIGHCFTGEYYSKFVPSEDVDCPCGKAFQTKKHLLRECPQYADQ
jgi:hypothetical protein